MFARLLDSGRLSVGVLSLMIGAPVAGLLNSTSSTPFSSAITALLCTTTVSVSSRKMRSWNLVARRGEIQLLDRARNDPERVVAGAAVDEVAAVARIPADHVVAAAGEDEVVERSARQHVGIRRADDDVGGRRAVRRRACRGRRRRSWTCSMLLSVSMPVAFDAEIVGDDDVAVRLAREAVGLDRPRQRVNVSTSVAAVDGVVAVPARERVVARVALQRVVAVAADEDVVAVVAEEGVVAVVAVDPVVAVAAVDHVVADIAFDAVVAGKAEDHVGRGRASDVLVSRRPDDARLDRRRGLGPKPRQGACPERNDAHLHTGVPVRRSNSSRPLCWSRPRWRRGPAIAG